MTYMRRILPMLVVSALCILAAHFGQTSYSSNNQSNIVTESELLENAYRYSSFTRMSDDSYMVEELEIEPLTCSNLEELSEVFMTAPYSEVNSSNIADGVNCQGMTVAIAEWCDKMEIPYQVFFSVNHVYITVIDTDYSYAFSFGEEPVIKKERNT